MGSQVFTRLFMADLISLDTYKTIENITNVKDDDRIETLITAISKLVKTYCASDLIDKYSTTITEFFDLQYSVEYIQLDEGPVVDNSTLAVYERQSQDDDYTRLYRDGTDDKYEWYLDARTDSIYRTSDSGLYRYWPKGVKCVKVEYNAGFESTPKDLELAVVDLVTYYFKDEHKQRRVLGGATLQNQGTSSLQDNVGFPDHIKRVLDMYKMK